MKRCALENNVTDEIPERNAGMTIRAVVFDIGGVLEITPPTGWVEKWEAIAAIQACLQASSPPVTYSVRYSSSGDENALEEEDCGSIDSSTRAGS